MPYIKDENNKRQELRIGGVAETAGELNYQIFSYLKYNTALSLVNRAFIVRSFVNDFLGENPNYQRYNDATGCLVRCKKEVERRLNQNVDFLTDIMESYDEEIENYEDLKIVENGDVE